MTSDAIPLARIVRAGLLVTAVVLVAWVRLLPLSLAAVDDQAAEKVRQDLARRVAPDAPDTVEGRAEIQRRVEQWIKLNRTQFEQERTQWATRLKAELSYRGADGRDHVYLGDYDSYAWLRHARHYWRTGTTCDAVIDGECRDTYTNAPVGRRDRYHRSLHIAAIVGVHRLITLFSPDYPLPASSFLVPVIVGVLGVFPAFGIARRLGGDLAGWCAAVLIGINPIFLQRSLGSDSDVWNLVLPLYMVWAATTALSVRSIRRSVALGVLAAIFAVLHAATWRGWVFTYGVLVLGLLGNAAVVVVRRARHVRGNRLWRDPEVHRAVVVLVVFCGTSGLLTMLAGTEELSLRTMIRPLVVLIHGVSAPHSSTATAPPAWPDALSTVAELRRPNLAGIAAFMGGALFFFVGWLGLMVLLLPRHGWRWQHFIVLIGGNYLYRYLLGATELSRPVLIALLAVPLVLAVILYALGDEAAAEGDQGAALTIVLWFIVALFLSFGGLRFVMLLVPPFAIACAVALGRLHSWFVGRAAALHLRHGKFASPILFVFTAALVVLPVRHGYLAARWYVPRLNDAWWDTLIKLRDQTPSASVVNTWWDYGYWVKYVAERQVTADGGSLLTHIPHWLGRALIATEERETIGLLRMLDCGSDATPEPESHAGAFGRLVGHGISEAAAHSMVVQVANLDRAAGRAYLIASGVTEEAASEILEATHCVPPPAYLLLSTEMIHEQAWQQLGSWDPEANGSGPRTSGYLTAEWQHCRPGAAGEMLCPIEVPIDGSGTQIESVTYVPPLPNITRLHLRRAPRNGGTSDWTPGLVLWADATSMQPVALPSATLPTIAVLIDVPNERVLLGPPRLLRSTFTHLMFLDGRYARYLEKFDDRSSYKGERLMTWKINWEQQQSPPP